MILSHLLQVKPFSQWEKLDMSSLERRKLLCSVSFHLIAVICVVWSLYVLIDRTADEIRTGITSNRPLISTQILSTIEFLTKFTFSWIFCRRFSLAFLDETGGGWDRVHGRTGVHVRPVQSLPSSLPEVESLQQVWTLTQFYSVSFL